MAEFVYAETTVVEVARLEREEQAGLADFGLGLMEVKRLTAAIQAEIVPAQVTVSEEHRRTCVVCGHVLASKGQAQKLSIKPDQTHLSQTEGGRPTA